MEHPLDVFFFVNMALSAVVVIVNLIVVGKCRGQTGSWVYFVLAGNGLIMLAFSLRLLIFDECSLRAVTTLMLATMIAVPVVLALGRPKCK